MARVDGKVAIVTGAGAGIGLATSRLLASEGARVVAADVNRQAIESLRTIDGVVAIEADVTSQAGVDRLIQAAIELGGIDVLVNNAGIMDAFTPAADVTDELWDRVFAVNVTGPLRLSRAAIPLMLEAGSGVIINVSSAAGLVGGKAGAAYTASKHALIGLTRHVAAAYAGDGLRCIAIAPGAVGTGMALGGEPSARGYATLEKTLPASPRVADPDELARVVLFLASDEASFVNGAVIPVDGGWLTF